MKLSALRRLVVSKSPSMRASITSISLTLLLGTLHPDIADGKVVAMPDPLYGEKACAFIISRPGRLLPSTAELGSFLLEKGLAKFKLPERIEPIDVFPITRVGKLDRAALRTIIADRLKKETGPSEQQRAP